MSVVRLEIKIDILSSICRFESDYVTVQYISDLLQTIFQSVCTLILNGLTHYWNIIINQTAQCRVIKGHVYNLNKYSGIIINKLKSFLKQRTYANNIHNVQNRSFSYIKDTKLKVEPGSRPKQVVRWTLVRWTLGEPMNEQNRRRNQNGCIIKLT